MLYVAIEYYDYELEIANVFNDKEEAEKQLNNMENNAEEGFEYSLLETEELPREGEEPYYFLIEEKNNAGEITDIKTFVDRNEYEKAFIDRVNEIYFDFGDIDFVNYEDAKLFENENGDEISHWLWEKSASEVISRGTPMIAEAELYVASHPFTAYVDPDGQFKPETIDRINAITTEEALIDFVESFELKLIEESDLSMEYSNMERYVIENFNIPQEDALQLVAENATSYADLVPLFANSINEIDEHIKKMIRIDITQDDILQKIKEMDNLSNTQINFIENNLLSK